MGRRQQVNRTARTTITIAYKDREAVVLGFPMAFTRPPEIVPLGIRHVLSTTHPVLAPEIAALWRAVTTAARNGADLRSLQPGDRVFVRAIEGEHEFLLTKRGFQLTTIHDIIDTSTRRKDTS